MPIAIDTCGINVKLLSIKYLLAGTDVAYPSQDFCIKYLSMVRFFRAKTERNAKQSCTSNNPIHFYILKTILMRFSM